MASEASHGSQDHGRHSGKGSRSHGKSVGGYKSENSIANLSNSVLLLPNVCWDLIIGQLRSRHKAALRDTCKRLRDAVNSTVTKIKLDPTHIEGLCSWNLQRRFPHLATLEFMKPGEYDSFTDVLLADFALQNAVQMRHLTELNLEQLTQVTPAGLQALPLAFTTLHTLTMPKVCQLCRGDSMLLLLSRLPCLSSLRLSCCATCDFHSLRNLSLLTRLTSLELDVNCPGALDVSGLATLKGLCRLVVEQSEDVAPAPEPLVPVLAIVQDVGPAGWASAEQGLGASTIMVPHTTTADLAFVGVPSIESPDFKSSMLNVLLDLTSLTHLDLQLLDMDTHDLARLTALTSLSHLGLKDLLFSSSRYSSGTGPGSVVLSNVEHLVLHNSLGEPWLDTTFPSLKSLSCEADENVLTSLAGMTQLSSLSLWSVSWGNLTDGSLAGLSRLKGLSSFRLEGAKNVSNAGLASFARHHTALSRLELVGCVGVGDLGLVLASRHLRDLRHLCLQNLPMLDLPGLATLLSFCPVRYLELLDCCRVAQAAVRELYDQVGNRELEVLYGRGGARRVLSP